jgi:hypothetical protein
MAQSARGGRWIGSEVWLAADAPGAGKNADGYAAGTITKAVGQQKSGSERDEGIDPGSWLEQGRSSRAGGIAGEGEPLFGSIAPAKPRSRPIDGRVGAWHP